MKSSTRVNAAIIAAVIKTMMVLVFFIAVFLFSGLSANAETDAALTVRVDGNTKKTFTMEELQTIAQEEGNVKYDFSAWNTFPTFSMAEDVEGPTVEGILSAAGVRASVTDKCTVRFSDKGGYKVILTGGQLLSETRYCYPKGGLVEHAKGDVPDEAYEGASEVKAVVSVSPDTNYKLFVGQVAPNEENNPLFVKNLSAGGYIDISTQEAPKCEPVEADPPSGASCRSGTEITLSSGNSYYYDKICYSYGRNSEPGYGGPIYNCGPQQDLECRPVVRGDEGQAVIEVVVKGYGKQDSDVQRLIYDIGDALTVRVDGVNAKSYDYSEVAALGSPGSLTYSGYNTYPTLNTKTMKKSVSVDAIISDATGSDPGSFGENSTISFTGADGYSSTFTIGQLFGTKRYYFPNASAGTDRKGGKAADAAYTGSTEVPAAIDLSGENNLAFGQAAPNEQNYAEFVSYMLSGGVIDIRTQEAAQCASVTAVSPADGSVVSIGTKITFPDFEKIARRSKDYYIVDPAGSQIPAEGCAFYHYSPYNWPMDYSNPPVLDTAGTHTVAVKISAYGKRDSEVSKFTYYVLPAAVKNVKASVKTYNSIMLTWSGQNGVSGYRIYRKEGSGAEKLYKTLNAGSVAFTDESLKTGTVYNYRIAALIDGPGGTVCEGDRSSAASASPQLKKPALKLKAGKRKVKVKWSKVAGASGYVVYRSVKKSKGYKAVKTVRKGKTVSFTNKKLKSGKKYYYKVRAFRKVGGRKVMGAYSAVRKVKAK